MNPGKRTQPRWVPQSSKLLILRKTDGRFDSDTFPLRFPLTLIVLLMIFSSLPAQSEKLFWDGYDWQRIDRITAEYPEYNSVIKNGYIRGIIDTRWYYFLRTWSQDTQVADSVFSDYLARFEIDEIVRGVDQFYESPEHRYLPVMSAVMITSLTAVGFPDSAIDEFTQASQQWINHLTMLYETEIPTPPEGIAQPELPVPAWMIENPPKKEHPRRWYFPDRKRLP